VTRLFFIDCGIVLCHNIVMRPLWVRRFPNSANNFDLRLADPQPLNFERLKELLGNILAERHRSLTLSSRAAQEFQRWFDAPDTSLKSDAYVLLSNWFTTQSGDRQSLVASRCEYLWDALFPCRPMDRLSSPEPGRNHVMIPAEFERFWQRLTDAQGGELPGGAGNPAESNAHSKTQATDFATGDASTTDQLRATFNKQGLHFEVEGSPRALADFLQFVSKWESTPGEVQ
jgi:hypothetical protein